MLFSPSLIAAAASKPTILDGGPDCEPKAGDYVIAYKGDRRMVQLRKGTVTLCGKKWVLPKEQLADVRFGVFPGTVRNGTEGGKEVRAEVNVEVSFLFSASYRNGGMSRAMYGRLLSCVRTNAEVNPHPGNPLHREPFPLALALASLHYFASIHPSTSYF
jgi:hypothetical protein